jgi:hypothetical protein
MEKTNFIFEIASDPKVLAYIGMVAVVVYLTKDKYR